MLGENAKMIPLSHNHGFNMPKKEEIEIICKCSRKFITYKLSKEPDGNSRYYQCLECIRRKNREILYGNNMIPLSHNHGFIVPFEFDQKPYSNCKNNANCEECFQNVQNIDYQEKNRAYIDERIQKEGISFYPTLETIIEGEE